MKALVGSYARPLKAGDPDPLYTFHGVKTDAQRFDLMQRYHDMMREAGLTPYFLLWHYKYRDDWTVTIKDLATVWPTHGGFWDGKTFKMPDAMEIELRKWTGRPYMFQHWTAGGVLKDDGRFVLKNAAGNVVRGDAPEFEALAIEFYQAAESYLRALGVEPYIFIDEPPIDYVGLTERDASIPDELTYERGGKFYYAKKEAEQFPETKRQMKLTRIVRKNTTLKVGQTVTTGEKYKLNEQLWLWGGDSGLAYNWHVFSDDWDHYVPGKLEYREQDIKWLIDRGAECWIYWVSSPWIDGDYADLERSIMRAARNGFEGCLFWTGIRLDKPPEKWKQSNWSLIADAPAVGLNEIGGWLSDFVLNTVVTPPELPPAESAGNPNLYQLFLTNDAGHFAAPTGLAAIPGWAQRAEVQIEFSKTKRNSAGDLFADGMTPGTWLEAEGVEVWYYVDPAAPVLMATQKAQAGVGDYEADPFWFRKRQVNAILANGWTLKDKTDADVIGGGRNRIVPDISNMDYVEWLAEAIAVTGVKRVFFDNFGPHQHGYHRPMKAAVSDDMLIAGMRALCDKLRAAGVKIIANAAWEMSDPDVPADAWTFPLMDYVDGVMIELEYTAGKAPASGFAKWSDGKWWTLNRDNLPAVIRRWRDAGKTVVLSATFRDTTGNTDYELFARDWYDFAVEHGCLFFTGRDDAPNKATHRVWPFALPSTPEPEPPDDGRDVSAILAEIQAARLDIAAGQAVLERARERLAVIEQLAVAL